MSEFDDSVLRDQLQRLGGHGPDEDGAYVRLQQRVRIAKRRRAAVVVGGLGVTLMLGFAAAAYQSPTSSHLAPADGGGNDVFVTVSSVTESTESTPSSSIEANEVTVATNAPVIVVENSSNSGKGSSNSGHGNGSSGRPASPITSTTSTLQPPTQPVNTVAPVPPAYETKTGVAIGGNATVKLQGGMLSFLDARNAPGFTYKIDKNDGDRIRITFQMENNGVSSTSHIEFTVGGDGHIQVDVTES